MHQVAVDTHKNWWCTSVMPTPPDATAMAQHQPSPTGVLPGAAESA
jgi:hypothetical protein